MTQSWIKAGLVALAGGAIFAACSGPGGNGMLPGGASSSPMLAPMGGPKGSISIRKVYAGMKYDGTAFTALTHKSCGHKGLGGLPSYTAPADGQLTLSADVVMDPLCVPKKHLPKGLGSQLYIFAISLGKHGKGGGTGHFNGVPIAGPVNITDSSWDFAPWSPGLTMVSGTKYDFVVASSWQHPSPEPSATPTTGPTPTPTST